MFSLFKKKKYPPFWKTYVDLVENSHSYSNFEAIRFVALDTETTGFNFEKDRMLCIGAVAFEGNKIKVADSFELYIQQDVYNKETVKIHGIRKHGTEEKFTEEETLIQFLAYLKDAVIVAHHTSFDVTMINCALERLGVGPLISKQLDTNYIHKKIAKNHPFNKVFSLDELCEIYHIPKHDRHTASGDALITARLFLKMVGNYRKNYALNLKDLILTNYTTPR